MQRHIQACSSLHSLGTGLTCVWCVQAGPRGALHKTIHEKIAKGENSFALAEAWFQKVCSGVEHIAGYTARLTSLAFQLMHSYSTSVSEAAMAISFKVASCFVGGGGVGMRSAWARAARPLSSDFMGLFRCAQ